KSQINPHFLYNSLNYIYSLAIPVSDKLASAVLHLSDLMRYTLKESADGKVKLQQEVAYIRNYIELFRMRFAPQFYVDFEAAEIDDKQTVPALILIPFVENAFKHGVVNEPERPVRIKLSVAGGRLTFTVSNKINRSQKDHSSGVGLTNIKRRLELLYPAKHELLISENGQTYKTTLNITLS
ncbi:MAG TPA: histidine kinase, partial [Sphingobacteriaceae bacterium]